MLGLQSDAMIRYANNHGRLYVEDDSYFVVYPQLMGSSPGGWVLGGKVCWLSDLTT